MKNFKILILLLIILCCSFSVTAFTKYDYVNHVETKADITSAYTHYEVCNPRGTPIDFSNAADKLDISFIDEKNKLASHHFEILTNVPQDETVNLYGDINNTYTCNNEFNYTTNPKHATCYDSTNGTIYWEGNFDTGNLQEKTIYYTTAGIIGTDTITYYNEKWKPFTPAGKTLQPLTCYDIKIVGEYKATTKGINIDNIISFGGYNYPEWSWWNSSFKTKQEFNVSFDNGLNDSTIYPLKIIFNNSNINYLLTNNDGSDLRFTDSTETNLLDYYILSWNETGNSYVYVNVTISDTTKQEYYIYYNNALATTKSNFNNTFGNKLLNWYPMQNNYTTDMSDSYNNVLTAIATQPDLVINENDILERNGGYASATTHKEISFTDATGPTDYTVTGSEGVCISYWAQHAGGSNDYGVVGWGSDAANQRLVLSLDYRTGQGCDRSQYFYVQGGGAGSACYVTPVPQNGTACDNNKEWHHYTGCVYDTGATTWAKYWVDGVVSGDSDCSADGGDFSISPNDAGINLWLGNSIGGALTNPLLGNLTDARMYKTNPNDLMSNNYARLLYDQPVYTFGEEVGSITATSLVSGLMDEDFNNISLLISERFDWYAFGNLTYDVNNSVVYPNSVCNWSANNVISEEHNETVGTNLTVCSSGCNTTDYITSFSDRHTENFVEDIFRYKLCRSSVATDTFTISNNCTGSYSFPHNTVSLCGNGYTDITVMDGNCSVSGDVELSITSTANALSKALVLIDSFSGNDLEHNISNELMVWNNTLQVFVTDHLHEFEEHGTKNISVDCSANVSSIENQTSIISVIVNNTPPNIFIDTIWWWLLNETPVSFTPSIQARYPLSNTVNVTGGCQDDDMFNAGANLSFANGTTIYSVIFPVSGNQVPEQINFTQSNFSTETNYLSGALEYSFNAYCNDTTGNITSLSRSFAAVNDLPVVTWLNTSPLLVGSMPTVINWSVTDAELETTTCYLSLNGTLNASGVGLVGQSINLSTGVYNYSLLCQDSFRNSTQTDLLLTFTDMCIPFVFGGVEAGGRYRELVKTVGVNCSNNIAISNCWYSTNQYTLESVSNCSLFNVTLQKGWNDLSLVVNDGFNTTTSFSVWATDPNSDVFDFVLLWVYFLALALFYALAVLTGLGVFYAFGGFMGLLIGYELVALSPWMGLAVGAAILIGSLTMLILKK